MVKKKAVSPMVSTVLLIMIVIILAVIILLWSQGFVKEAIKKNVADTEKTVQQWCGELELTPIVNGQEFGFENKGNIPVYAFNLKTVKSGSSFVQKIDSPDGSVNPGFSIILDPTTYAYDDNEEIIVIPILLGQSESGETQEVECDERDGLTIK